MAISRHIPFSLHTVVELMLGLFLLVAPGVLHASTAGVVLGVALGALVMGLAMNGSGIMDGHDERPPLSLAAHRLADVAVGVLLAGAAIAMAFAGDFAAALTFTAGAVAAKTLGLSTRYTAPE